MNVDRLAEHRAKMVDLLSKGEDAFDFCMKEVIPVVQETINTGEAWWMHEAAREAAKYFIRTGHCTLPNRSFVDFNGEHVPSRSEYAKEQKLTIEVDVIAQF